MPLSNGHSPKDLTGQVFGTRTAVSCAGRDKHRNATWIRCLGSGVVDRLARGQTIDEIDNDLTFKFRPLGKESV